LSSSLASDQRYDGLVGLGIVLPLGPIELSPGVYAGVDIAKSSARVDLQVGQVSATNLGFLEELALMFRLGRSVRLQAVLQLEQTPSSGSTSSVIQVGAGVAFLL
jgi:hypothetical protein